MEQTIIEVSVGEKKILFWSRNCIHAYTFGGEIVF